MTLQRSAGNAAVSRALIQREVQKVVTADEHDEFGRFDHSFRWTCTAPHTDGFIVQRIDRVETVGNKTEQSTYWEAWTVVGGRIHDAKMLELTHGAHDSWVNPDPSFGTAGSWSMTGTVYWVAGNHLPGDFQPNAVKMAGGLLSTAEDPELPDSALLFTHRRTYAWDATTLKAAKDLLKEWSQSIAIERESASEELQEDAGFTPAIADQAVSQYLAERDAPKTTLSEVNQ